MTCHPTSFAETSARRLTIAGHRLVLLSAAAYEVAFIAKEDTIGFAFDGQSGSHAIGSDRRQSFCRYPNSLALTPKGCEVRSASATGGEYLLLSGATCGLIGDRYRTNLACPKVVPAALELRKWLLGGRVPDVLQAEACLSQLIDFGATPRRPDKAARWMTPMRYRRISELIETNLGATLTVAGLAGAIGVSPSFLSRSFSAFCGQSPYDYIISRRIQRARRLMTESRLPLADIASAAGFSSQGHMSTTFRTRLGIAPGHLDRTGDVRGL